MQRCDNSFEITEQGNATYSIDANMGCQMNVFTIGRAIIVSDNPNPNPMSSDHLDSTTGLSPLSDT